MKPASTAIEVIQKLLDLHSEIADLRVFVPSPTPKAQERIDAKHPEAQPIINAGLEIRERTGLPFWDSVLLACYGQGSAASTVLAQALFHNSPPLREFNVAATSWSESYLDRFLNDIQQSVLVVNSSVQLNDGQKAHIPMLDFRCPATAQNRELAINVSHLLDSAGGYLLESGQSFHFYGKSLLRANELSIFLGRALLLSPVVDRAWVAHQLIEGSCGLRISSRKPGELPPFLTAEV